MLKVSQLATRLAGLKPSTAYLISVRAQNSAGLGPSSPAVSATTRKPREFKNEAGFWILWGTVISLRSSVSAGNRCQKSGKFILYDFLAKKSTLPWLKALNFY